ncbi:ATP-binding protein [bacterium]|nr:ATP-binding protein [Candidatus Elulimicrobium humile]
MLSRVQSASTLGLNGQKIEIEVDITQGLPGITIVGLPDTAINEAKERIRLGLKNSGIILPQKRFVLNLAPAEVKKIGTAYDLPMAIAILKALELIQFPEKEYIILGELGLDGAVRAVQGILPITVYAKENNIPNLIIPASNAKEASLVDGVNILAISHIQDIIDHFDPKVQTTIQTTPKYDYIPTPHISDIDMAYIRGQKLAKRALEIAAAGGHNVLMTGPPGAGKTLLSRTIPTILPMMDREEVLEVSQLYSIAGNLNSEQPLITSRPFRAPHHTASSISLIGGGSFPKPGEISLSHRGVLYMDEFPEFPRLVLESLRQPLEDRIITISRAQGSLTFPADFMLIASQNPCPCGYLTDNDRECICSQAQIVRYQQKISGPLLDRIDMIINIEKVKTEELIQPSEVLEESSEQIRKRVESAREIQRQRFKNWDIKTNSSMNIKQIQEICVLDKPSQQLLSQAVNKMNLSARAYNRILKISRTIADLSSSSSITINHIAEALQYREKVS